MANCIVGSFIGHTARSFDVQLCNDSLHCISASEDGTARLWDISSRKCIATLKHNVKSEVLRVGSIDELLCTCGSDGRVVLWQKDEKGSGFSAVHEVSHGDNQIYACEVLNIFGSVRFRFGI